MLKVTGLDAIKRRLQEVQRPEFWAQKLDEKYRNLRCPEHGRSPKHKIAATKKSMTVTYCCAKLKEMHRAKVGAGQVPPASVPAEPETEELPIEEVVESPGEPPASTK